MQRLHARSKFIQPSFLFQATHPRHLARVFINCLSSKTNCLSFSGMLAGWLMNVTRYMSEAELKEMRLPFWELTSFLRTIDVTRAAGPLQVLSRWRGGLIHTALRLPSRKRTRRARTLHTLSGLPRIVKLTHSYLAGGDQYAVVHSLGRRNSRLQKEDFAARDFSCREARTLATPALCGYMHFVVQSLKLYIELSGGLVMKKSTPCSLKERSNAHLPQHLIPDPQLQVTIKHWTVGRMNGSKIDRPWPFSDSMFIPVFSILPSKLLDTSGETRHMVKQRIFFVVLITVAQRDGAEEIDRTPNRYACMIPT
ncbi:uncharacterized protein EV420DRAFT_1480878 [Desarmillaria tabescens]|uniref:Uncharacterized protein n=1 Tax=Armillaria tabescens TaxID=1929756 RepID=A0AA39KDW9_ARMTA|nr:uncharacterized protein EV420DRAFT_1480878 [Desarmillaria tabescens]KAK0457003.1 hypothetical protein EV420DRAFT_1480878 [Desarmillaria tabescens]